MRIQLIIIANQSPRNFEDIINVSNTIRVYAAAN